MYGQHVPFLPRTHVQLYPAEKGLFLRYKKLPYPELLSAVITVLGHFHSELWHRLRFQGRILPIFQIQQTKIPNTNPITKGLLARTIHHYHGVLQIVSE